MLAVRFFLALGALSSIAFKRAAVLRHQNVFRGRPLLRRMGLKRLVGEGGGTRHLHNDKAPADTSVAGIAGSGEFAIGLGEHRAVLCFDGLGKRQDRIRRIRYQLHWNSPIEVRRALEARPDLIDLVGREFPVRELAREPQLDVAQLDFTHDVAQRRLVGILLGDGERCQDQADAKSSDHGKTFHFRTSFHQSLVRRGTRIDPTLPTSVFLSAIYCNPLGNIK